MSIVHGTPWTTAPETWDLVDRAFAEQFISLTEGTLSTTAFVVVPSTYARDCLLAGYNFTESQIAVVPHGVDITVFTPDSSGGKEMIGAALGRERPYVLFVSVAAPQKNLHLLLKAMNELARLGFPHAVAIAGADPPDRGDALWTVSRSLPALRDRIIWLGRANDRQLAGLMAEADAFCLPSLLESFGLTALEALACGAPVVVSNRGALPEVVGDAAIVTEPDLESIQVALEAILADANLAQRLRAAGPVRARALSWDKTADGWFGALARTAATA